jgi:glycosyltransferase involved in cell wall biosynthesis
MAIIAFNTRLLQKGKLEGIGWYTFETLRRIVLAHPEHQFLFIFDRPFHPDFVFAPNVKAIYAGPPTRHIILFLPWFEIVIPYLLKKHKVDLFVSPDGHISLLSNTDQLAVIHDINFHHYPKTIPYLVRTYYNFFFPRFARKAKRIAVVSEYTKADIVQSYHINPDKIDVTLNGCNDQFIPISYDLQEATKAKFSKGLNYFLFVGLIIPRKNLITLMNAYSVFRKNGGDNIALLVVGEKKWWDQAHENAFQKNEYKTDIIFLGRLQADELHHVMASAFALTFVPLFEGFGIPVLEAFACGTPVISSNTTSIPEVAGGAAILVDPLDFNNIAAAMMNISKSKELRNDLINKGLDRRKAFSWEITAEALWTSISACLDTKDETKKIRLPKEPAKQ